MARLRKMLDELAKALGLQNRLLDRAQSRYTAARKRAFKANAQKDAAAKKADQLRKQKHPERAERKDKKAARLRVRALREHHRAQFWLGRVKQLQRRVNGIEDDVGKVKKELAAEQKKHGVTIKGNKASGGTAEQRWRAVCLKAVENCSTGHRRNYYAQWGYWDCQHEITPGPKGRSDCSQFVTGMAWSADLPDPNGEDWHGGFTGTLISESNGWHATTREKMVERGWGYIVYGSGTGHHTEAYIGGNRTVGHGSPPVDFGVIDLFGSGEYQRYFVHT